MNQERQTLKAVLQEELAILRRRIAAIEVLLSEDGSVPAIADAPSRPTPRRTGVSKAKMKMVRQYLEKHGEARQVDIARDLKENSGTVSMALAALEADGDVEDTGRIDRRAKVWRFTGEPERVVTVEPGVGLGQGRRK